MADVCTQQCPTHGVEEARCRHVLCTARHSTCRNTGGLAGGAEGQQSSCTRGHHCWKPGHSRGAMLLLHRSRTVRLRAYVCSHVLQEHLFHGVMGVSNQEDKAVIVLLLTTTMKNKN